MVQKKSKKVLIICSDFYKEISDNLLKGSETYLKEQKVPYEKKNSFRFFGDTNYF